MLQNVCICPIMSLCSIAAETASQDLIRNALHSFGELKVTETYTAANEKMVMLTERYTSSGELYSFIEILDRYKAN